MWLGNLEINTERISTMIYYCAYLGNFARLLVKTTKNIFQSSHSKTGIQIRCLLSVSQKALLYIKIIIIIIIIIIIGIQPLGRSGQRPEFSQETGMALVHCILGKFLAVACHCFTSLFRCSLF